MKALVSTGDESVAVADVPTPKPGKGEILVKVTYVAQNPADWKVLSLPPGRIIGCDFAGTVADSNGSQWAQGQRVAGWVHGKLVSPLRGAFAEYLVTESDMVFPTPDNVSDQQASTVGCGFATTIQSMVQRLGLPEPGHASGVRTPFLVNGGSTAVGMYAIQFAKLCGLYVFATGSRKNHPLLKSLGADMAIDYKNSNWPSRVRRISEGNLEHVMDCVGDFSTILACASALSPTKGGHVVTLLPASSVRDSKEVDMNKIKLESTVAYTVFGRPVDGHEDFDNCGGSKPAEDRAICLKYQAMLPELLSSGKIKPNTVKDFGGLDDISKGFEEQKAGRVSAEKLVYKVG